MTGFSRRAHRVVVFVLAGVLVTGFSITATTAYGYLLSPNAYSLSVIAGRPGVRSGTPASTDSPSPDAVASDSSGNTYVGDRNGYVEKVSPSGTLTIVAGNGDAAGQPVPGPATSSPLDPVGIALDASGDLFVADAHGYVVRVTPQGEMSIVAGNGTSNQGLNPGQPATSSSIVPGPLTVDGNGNLYIGLDDDSIVEVAPDGTLSVLEGNGANPASSWSSVGVDGYVGVDGLAVNATGDLFISAAQYVFKLTSGKLSIIAGDGGTYGSVGNWPPLSPAPATSGPLTPTGVATDSAGNVYVTNGPAVSYESRWSPGGTVLKIAPDDSMVVIAGLGQGTPARLARNLMPAGVAVDASGNVLVADGQGFIDEVTPIGGFSQPVGNPEPNTPIPGTATQSPMRPNAVAYDSDGALYIADDNGYVEKVSAPGTLSIVAGNGDFRSAPIAGAATSSPMRPWAIAVGTLGSVYVADRVHAEILKITAGGVMSIVAGSFGDPVGVATDTSGNVYVADHNGYIDRIAPDGSESIVAGHGNDTVNNPSTGPATAVGMVPTGIALDTSGDLYISTYEGFVDKVTPDGNLTHVAGGGSNPPSLAAQPALSTSISPSAIAVDGSGNLFISDVPLSGVTLTGRYIDEVTAGGNLSVIAGNGDIASAPVEGWATSSPLQPSGVSVNAGGKIAVSDWDHGDVAGLSSRATTVPSAPTNASARAGSSSATVSFTPSIDTGGSQINGYTVSDGHGHSCAPTTLTSYGNGDVSCQVTGLTPGASYAFRVTATNSVGTSAPSSPSNSVTPYTLPSAPTGVTAAPGPSTANISWTAPASDGWSPILGYSVIATDTSNSNITSTVCPDSWTSVATSCRATGLTNGHTYTFAVAAWNNAGTGPASSPSTPVTPLAPPAAPNSVFVTAGDGSVTAFWYTPDDGGSPITYYTATAEPGGAQCVASGGSPNRCTIGSLTNGVTYTVTVTATNVVGTSPPSNASSATPQASPPTITNTAKPTIGGSTRVGARLAASPGTWSASSLSYRYQWFANGVALSGATASAFTPTAAQLGKTLTVLVMASRTGYNSGSAKSAATPAVARGVITNKTLPAITGTKRVGYTLTASVGTWSPSGLTYHYQWFRGTTAIRGAVYRTFKLTASMHGYRVRVRVTASRAGYASLARYSYYTVSIR